MTSGLAPAGSDYAARVKVISQTLDMLDAFNAMMDAQGNSFPTAQAAMTSLKKISYLPKPAAQKTYDQLYALYRSCHDAFGGVNKSNDLSRVMKELLAIKDTTHG